MRVGARIAKASRVGHQPRVETGGDVLVDGFFIESAKEIGDQERGRRIGCVGEVVFAVAMTVDVMVRWKLDPDKLLDLYRNYPNLNWKDKTIASIVRQTMRFVTANFTAVETVEKREYIAAVMKEEIWERLQAEATLAGAISYFEFDLRNIGLPSKYTSAIEAKLVAEQQKLQAEFERSRILILANASAQEQIIKAAGIAKAKIIIANGTRAAIRMAIEAAGITNSSRIAELYLWVEALKEISPNVDVLIIATGEGGVPIIYQLPKNSTSSP